MSRKNILFSIITLAFLVVTIGPAMALPTKTVKKSVKQRNLKSTTAGCDPSVGFEWLNINNIRCQINTGGDMWFGHDGLGGRYYVPAKSTKTSLFCGSLWIGGLDINKQLKLAAHMFRSEGNDFWAGPLTADRKASIDEETCSLYDRFFKMTREMVDEYVAHTDPETGAFIGGDGYTIPAEIKDWPAHGYGDDSRPFLAPFFDNDGDGFYDPNKGDYPYYDLNNELCADYGQPIPESDPKFTPENSLSYIKGGRLVDQVIKGDETLWWVFNDKGNIHTETKGEAIGLEIRAQAFAFATNNEINNMTFYSYEIINRSTYELTQTFFSPWIDTDLGYAADDYVGCDVSRGLGYCYNGVDIDGSGSSEAYGVQPPAVGMDFFQGPYIDPDGEDNPAGECDASVNGTKFGDGIPDNERYGMRRFVYHNIGSGGTIDDPETASDYYNYLRGIWKDNSRMQYGGNGHVSGGAVGPDADFMFPGDSDPCNWGTGGTAPNDGFNVGGKYWTEEQVENAPGDRRFMQSAGPFTLQSGAVNYITVGVPWARASSGGAWASVEKLRKVDDKCQALFDRCFKIVDGPDAPDLSFSERDQKLVVYISNPANSNNFGESYDERDDNFTVPEVPNPAFKNDSTYTFEGYIIYQLSDASVSPDEYDNMDKARIIAQFDVKNGASTLVNLDYDDYTGLDFPSVKVVGADDGIKHAFEVTEDLFAEGDNALVNFKTYHYSVVAYAHNEYLPFSSDPSAGLLEGQKRTYLEGRRNIKVYSKIPHKVLNGTIQRAEYGDGVEVTRLQGRGNGGFSLEMKPEQIDELMTKAPASPTNQFGSETFPMIYHPTYEEGHSPINVKVIDPLKVRNADYELRFTKMETKRLYDILDDIEVTYDNLDIQTYKWILEEKVLDDAGNVVDTKTYESDTTIDYQYDQIFTEIGLAISPLQSFYPGVTPVGKVLKGNPGGTSEKKIVTNYVSLTDNTGLLSSEASFEDPEAIWMSGVSDFDIPPSNNFNWIRSGDFNRDGDNYNDTKVNTTLGVFFADEAGAFEKIFGGTWTAWNLIAAADEGADYSPLPSIQSKFDYRLLRRLNSVDIILTNDKSKWTRSPVFEMCADPLLAQNNGERFKMRKAPSVDKDGNQAAAGSEASEDPNDPAYINAEGMGWFPGYAVDIETGARLNISFTEDSYLADLNGADMLFNPAERDGDIPLFFDPVVIDQASQTPLYGGKHFAQIWGVSERTITPPEDYADEADPFTMKFTAYDGGRNIVYYLDSINNYYDGNVNLGNSFPANILSAFWSSIDYVGAPLAIKGKEWLACDFKLKIRIEKPYERTLNPGFPIDEENDSEMIAYNNYNPAYSFSTSNISPIKKDEEKIQTDLDLVGIVPNPYNAFSSYESNALQNIVKIINLPDKCTVSIYNVNGTLIRQLEKDTPEVTFLNWDLKNFANVPISGGVYLFHIKSDQGTRIVKWFGTLRQVDLNKF